MSSDSPASIIFNTDGYELTVKNNITIPANTPTILVAGSDGTVAKYILIDGSARQVIAGAGVAGTPTGGVLTIQGVSGGTNLPISAATLPLPTGAATETTLATLLTNSTFTTRINTLGQKTMANSMPVVIASDQTVNITTQDNVASGSLGALNAAVTVSTLGQHGVGMQMDAGTFIGGVRPEMSRDGGTTWVRTYFDDDILGSIVGSFSFAAANTAQNRSIILGSGVTHVRIIVISYTSGSCNVLLRAGMTYDPSVLFASGVDFNFQPPTVAQIGGWDGTNLRAVRMFDLDTGAGTESNLGVNLRISASGASIEAKSQQNMANSIPVVIASDQTVIPVSDNGGSLTVDGTITANIGTTNGLSLDATLTGGTQTTRITDGTNTATVKAASTSAVSADKALVVAISPNNTIAISGTVTSNIGTTNGLALDTTLAKLTISQGTALGTNTQSLMGGSVTVAAPTYSNGNINPLSLTTVGALRVDGSAVTQPISAASLPLPTGAATETTLGSILTTTAFQARINTLGQKTMSASTPVVLSSDQSAIPVTGTFFQATQPVSGTVTANAGTGNFTVVQATATNLRAQTAAESATGAVPPAQASYTGGSVTTAPPTYTTGQMNALSLTTAGLLRVDGSGVAQPISAASLPLPAGAATETTLGGVLTITAFQTRINTLGQKTMANSTPVVFASDQTVIPVSDNAGSLTVDGTVTSNQGAAAAATSPWSNRLSDGTAFYNTNTAGQLPTALVGGRLDVNNGAWLGSTAPTVGQKTMANSVPVTIASDQVFILVKESPASASTLTNITGSATSVTVVPANANRRRVMLTNDSNQDLYLKFGATASITSYTVKIPAKGYFEFPDPIYTGIVDGIWSAANGAARVTELT